MSTPMESFDKDHLKQSLTALEPWKRVVFMLLCCARMLPNYEKFSAETGFGSSSALRQAMQSAWTWLETGIVPPNLERVKTELEELTPDTEGDFASLLTSAALDAAAAIATTLDAVDAPSHLDVTELAVSVATLARDTVDLYVQFAEDIKLIGPELDDITQRHPLMQTELRCQREDIERLERWSEAKLKGVESFEIEAKGQRGSLDESTS